MNNLINKVRILVWDYHMLIQVKVWFQNRRMKWRHSKEAKHQQSSTSTSESRCTREEQGGPDSTQEPEIDVQTVDS
jgi:hypothetical protein